VLTEALPAQAFEITAVSIGNSGKIGNLAENPGHPGQ
jgi:hypothetical protein